MLAIDSAGVWAGRGSTLHSTAQTPVPSSVPNQRNMAAPYWDNGGFTFLQWKWVKVRRPSFLQSMLQNYKHFVKLDDCRNLQCLVFANRLPEEFPECHHVAKKPNNHRRTSLETRQTTTASAANPQPRGSLNQERKTSPLSSVNLNASKQTKSSSLAGELVNWSVRSKDSQISALWVFSGWI